MDLKSDKCLLGCDLLTLSKVDYTQFLVLCINHRERPWGCWFVAHGLPQDAHLADVEDASCFLNLCAFFPFVPINLQGNIIIDYVKTCDYFNACSL